MGIRPASFQSRFVRHFGLRILKVAYFLRPMMMKAITSA